MLEPISPELRRELDGLQAALAAIRLEFVQYKRGVAISEEEIHKRLLWYSHLERLVVVVNEFVSAKPEQRMEAERELRETFEQVRMVHRLCSPATLEPEVEQERATAAGVSDELEVLRRPA
jgi:hypothetical protein